MSNLFKICLIGSIPKGDEARKNWQDWKKDYKNILSELPSIEFVDGDAWRDETKPFLLFGHDCYMIKNSDLIIADSHDRLGAGTAQEMLIAKYFRKPVITVLPKNTYHRKSNIVFDGKEIKDWIHPFVLTISDLVVENIKEAIPWIRKYQADPGSKDIKGITIIDKAIEGYIKIVSK